MGVNPAHELKAARKEQSRIATEVDELWKKARQEDNRDLTPEEADEVMEHHKSLRIIAERVEDLEREKAQHDEIKRLSGGVLQDESSHEITEVGNHARPIQAKSIGEMVVESEQFKSLAARGFKGHFSTGPIELQTKGTLLTGDGSPGDGTGGGLLPVPGVIPGVVDTLFQRVTVENLLPSIQVTGNSMRYVVEGTATSGAAGVAEAGTKPESTLALSTTDEPIKKVATSLTVSDEMLEDPVAVRGYIDSRLGLFVTIETERQLVGGAGTAELVGLTGRGINTLTAGTADNQAVALFKCINGTRGSSFLEPDAIVMNPTDWQATRLLTDGNNQFYGGGPFTGAYGNGPTAGGVTSGQLTGATDSIWNKPVIVTTAIGAGTALVGAFSSAAAVLQRSGLSVEASNSHSTYFTSNLVAIRAERRLGLAVYRPSAFTALTF